MEDEGNLFPPQSRGKLETPERYRDLRPVELLRDLGLRPGDQVVDLGAGTGFFSIAAASIVGKDGAVWAVDLQAEMVEELKRRAAEAGCQRITVVKANALATGLPDGVGNVAILAFVIHEVEDKVSLLSEVRRLVGRDGKTFIIDFDRKRHPNPELDHGPPLEIRVDPEQLADLGRQAGLRLSKLEGVSPIVYAAVLEDALE